MTGATSTTSLWDVRHMGDNGSGPEPVQPHDSGPNPHHSTQPRSEPAMSMAPPPPTCIRRPDSTWTSCRCDDCRAYMARMSKRHRAGLITRADSDEAWRTLDRLIERRWSPKAIASATGTNFTRWHGTLREFHKTGRRRPLHHSTCVALANMGDPTDGRVGIVGSRRRLQGLARQGYDLRTVAEVTGIGFSTLGMIRNRPTGQMVAAPFYVVIRDFADSVGLTPGPSSQGIMTAARKGWPGLLTWDDIDDPSERPRGSDYRPKTDVDEAVVLRVMAGERLPMTTAERFAVVARLRARGFSLNEIETHTGIGKPERYVGEVAA